VIASDNRHVVQENLENSCSTQAYNAKRFCMFCRNCKKVLNTIVYKFYSCKNCISASLLCSAKTSSFLPDIFLNFDQKKFKIIFVVTEFFCVMPFYK